MSGAFLFGAAYCVAPAPVTDWRVRDVAVPLRGAHLTGGSCCSKLFVHDCLAMLTLPGGTAPDRDVYQVLVRSRSAVSRRAWLGIRSGRRG